MNDYERNRKAEEALHLEREAQERPRAWLEAAALWQAIEDPLRSELALLRGVDADVSGAVDEYGRFLQSQGRTEGARDFYARIALQQPSAYLALATLAETVGAEAEARSHYEAALAYEVAGARSSYAALLMRVGDTDHAIHILQAGIASGTRTLLVDLSAVYQKLGDEVSAESCLITALHERQSGAYYPYAALLKARGDTAGALRINEIAVQHGSTYHLIAVAELRAELGDEVGAEVALAEGTERGNSACRRRYAERLLKRGDFAGALHVAAGETTSAHHTLMAQIHAEAGNHEQAELAFEMALANGGYNVAENFIAYLEQRGLTPDREAIFDRAIAGGDQASLLKKAQTQEAHDDLLGAELSFARYASASPSAFGVEEFAKFFLRQGQTTTALEVLDAAAVRAPGCLLAKAQILINLDRHAEAVTQFEQAVERTVPGAVPCFAQYLSRRGDHERAAGLYLQAARGRFASGYDWLQAATAFIKTENRKEVENAFGQARRLGTYGASRRHAAFLLTAGDAPAAERVLVEDATAQPELWTDVARLRRDNGEITAAMDAYRRAVKHDPRGVGQEFGEFLVHNGLLEKPARAEVSPPGLER